MTFNTQLRQEYQCLLDAMLLAGLSDDEAHQWLEQVRLCTLDHRFTIARQIQRPLNDIIHVP